MSQINLFEIIQYDRAGEKTQKKKNQWRNYK